MFDRNLRCRCSGQALLVAAAMCAAACGSTDGAGGVTVGTSLVPPQPSTLTLRLTQPLAATAPTWLPAQAASGIVLTAAAVHIRHIEFDAPSVLDCAAYAAAAATAVAQGAVRAGCERGRLRFSGPFVVDLLPATMSALRLALPRGLYTRVRLRVDDGDEARGDDLAGVSVVAQATWTTTQTTALNVALSLNEDIEYGASAPLAVTDSGSAMALELQAAAWLAGAPAALAACLAEAGEDDDDLADADGIGDGVLRLGDGDAAAFECDEFEELLKANFRNAGGLDADDEHDDDADDEHDTDDDADDSDATIAK